MPSQSVEVRICERHGFNAKADAEESVQKRREEKRLLGAERVKVCVKKGFSYDEEVRLVQHMHEVCCRCDGGVKGLHQDHPLFFLSLGAYGKVIGKLANTV